MLVRRRRQILLDIYSWAGQKKAGGEPILDLRSSGACGKKTGESRRNKFKRDAALTIILISTQWAGVVFGTKVKGRCAGENIG